MADRRTRSAASSGAWAPLARATFRNLSSAQLGSNVGTWMQSVGAQWFLLETTRSPALVAWVQTASLLPVLLLSLVAGVLADSADRRLLLIVTTAASTVAAGVLWLLSSTGALTPWSLLVMTFVLGSLAALTNPAWQAIQPELVPREQIAAAASLSSITVNAARAIGPAVAGVLVSLNGPTLVFALDAASFVGVTGVLIWWKRPARRPALGREAFGPAAAAGLRYVRAAPGVRRILLRSALFVIPACVLWALLPSVADSELGFGSSGYGLLLGVLGAGAVLGVALMPTLRRRLSPSWVLAGSAIVYAAGLIAPATGSLPVVVIAFILTGLAWIATLTTLNAAMQLTLAEWVRARGMAFYLLVFLGGQGIASFGWGIVAGYVGSQACLLIGAGLLLVVAASVPFVPLHPLTGRLDRTISALSSAAPTLVFEPDADDGPVIVAVEYVVQIGQEAEFVAAMRGVEMARRRTGARRWRLDRSGEHERHYREEFVVPSWGEFTRSIAGRWTGFDHELLDAVIALTDGEPQEEHYFPAL
ncbi:MFS transporter [Galbitalea sp. SE-J8]|uniref:MFS transporter n=1 Tax=Galbitalea sp. SE-J8 TaxID=3054952 RepID=UPI00259C8056|nr:MFS transporter [Galbitalea sp. SE-J8]MDM4761742.1 MFS transporter [Galbitalea sp. SE-J8]